MTTFKGAVQRLGLIALTVMGISTGKSFADELNIYNWGEYINPAVLQKFEEETKIKVNLSTYSSNEEMLAKIQGGASGYDIVFPSVHMQDIQDRHQHLCGLQEYRSEVPSRQKRPEGRILPALCLRNGWHSL
jgi:spermidine/putrescine transport system substrate-binding protein